MLYKLLKQRNPDYDKVLWDEIDLLYEGGYKAMRAAKDYLPMLDGERVQRYDDRVRLVAYVGYMGEIVDFFCASLFESGLDITEAVDADDPDTTGEPAQKEDYWQEFAKNADLQRTPFSMVLRHAVKDALCKRRALVACDFPDPGQIPTTRAEEKKLGADRGYCYNVPLDQLIDWELDDFGRFKWCILYETAVERADPTKVRGRITHTWTVWTLEDVAQGVAEDIQTALNKFQATPATPPPVAPTKGPIKARWAKYGITVSPDFNDWKDDLDIPLIESDTTSFDRIPILQLELPMGLWAGNHLGPMAREHWERRSHLVGAESRNMTAVGYLELGKPSDDGVGVDAIDPTTRAEMKRRFGVEMAVPGKLAFAEPNGHAYEVVDKQIDKLKDEMFRVAHQMAMSADTSRATQQARSGESKQQDKKDVAVVLGALAVFTKDFGVEIYETIAVARSEADVVWTAHGLDKFVDDDRASIVQEAATLEVIADGIPSPTWKKEYKTQQALKLTPNLPPETQDTIRKEIADGVEQHQELDDILLEQDKEAALDTPTPGDQLKAQTEVAKVKAAQPQPAAPAAGGKPAPKQNGKSGSPAQAGK